ncbi:hypothetical protein [Desulforegula conservatrix]|uniref:hypothetical protein n=1 Tax=Desulforegula conservatrix TaxID=153026 RepID=UPI00047FD466|nr:hypothetical protein [Desulforegula conservatrix]
MALFDFLSKLRDKLGQQETEGIRPKDELWEAVDLVVKMSHPNVHYVPNYRKKLMPAVEHTLKYADELVAQMTTLVSIHADSWNKDPFLRKIFLNNRMFNKLFTENKALTEFFQKTGASRCCALLVMDRKDKNIFGAELEGEIINRDVLKTSISFSNHQIVVPSISEEETRKELSTRALILLTAHALEEIMSIIAWKKEMETEKKTLEVKLQIHNAYINSTKSLLPDKSETDDAKEVSEIIDQLDQKIAEAREEIDEPEDYLNRVTNLLYHPEFFLKYEAVRLLVNDMNVIVENDQLGKVDEINFLELSTASGLKKATVLVDCNRF